MCNTSRGILVLNVRFITRSLWCSLICLFLNSFVLRDVCMSIKAYYMLFFWGVTAPICTKVLFGLCGTLCGNWALLFPSFLRTSAGYASRGTYVITSIRSFPPTSTVLFKVIFKCSRYLQSPRIILSFGFGVSQPLLKVMRPKAEWVFPSSHTL